MKTQTIQVASQTVTTCLGLSKEKWLAWLLESGGRLIQISPGMAEYDGIAVTGTFPLLCDFGHVWLFLQRVVLCLQLFAKGDESGEGQVRAAELSYRQINPEPLIVQVSIRGMCSERTLHLPRLCFLCFP